MANDCVDTWVSVQNKQTRSVTRQAEFLTSVVFPGLVSCPVSPVSRLFSETVATKAPAGLQEHEWKSKEELE